ncbi:hypothetical protein [Cohnella massiliensis]|uniref:hypothetical protein n=1 Tax=Cohnella massiliensis TaxID=1816691 RepID=UPI0009BC6ACB|nr:hypothetical protein [Cohnella massiliensis]
MNNDVVYIQLDRKRELRFGHKALKQLVALTGKSLEEIESSGFDDLDYVEKFVYCGLLKDARDNNETLKLEQMEDLLDQAPTYVHIVKQIQAAFAAAFGSRPEGNQTPGEPESEPHTTGTKASE